MNRRTAIILVGVLAASMGLSVWPASRAQENTTPPQEPPMASARFAFGGDAAQVPAEFIGGLVLVPVHVNDSRPMLFELDSTAAASSADPDRATALGIANLKDPALNLSGVDILLPTLATIPNKNFVAQVGRPYEGTLGNDVFAGVVIELDYSRQTVRLYDPATYQYTGRGKSLPLTFVGGMPVVQAKFNLTGHKDIEASFVVNTALDASLAISDKFAQAHSLFSSHMKTIPDADLQLGGGQGVVLARMSEFQIGSNVVAQPIAAFASGSLPGDSDPRIAGEIGARMLRRFTVVFDFPRHEMILYPNGDFRMDDHEDMSGISIIAGGPGLKKFEVTQVRSGTPGSDAKIQKGDVIAGVDEEAAADLSLADIRNLFRQVAQKHKLLIERDGKTFTVTIQTRRLL